MNARPVLIIPAAGFVWVKGRHGDRHRSVCRRVHPLVRVIGLSAHVDLHRVAEICAAGAIGYVVKHSAGADLVAAIRQASQNRTYFSRALGITGLDELAAYQQR